MFGIIGYIYPSLSLSFMFSLCTVRIVEYDFEGFKFDSHRARLYEFEIVTSTIATHTVHVLRSKSLLYYCSCISIIIILPRRRRRAYDTQQTFSRCGDRGTNDNNNTSYTTRYFEFVIMNSAGT